MLAKLKTFSLLGIEALPVEVEVDVSPGALPKTVSVGLPEAAVRESTHRVERAIVNSGFMRPQDRIVIDLGPGLPKAGGLVRPADHAGHPGRQRAVAQSDRVRAVRGGRRTVAGRTDAADEGRPVDGHRRRAASRACGAGGAQRERRGGGGGRGHPGLPRGHAGPGRGVPRWPGCSWRTRCSLPLASQPAAWSNSRSNRCRTSAVYRALLAESRGPGVVQQVGQLLQLDFFRRQIVAGRRVHQPQPGLDAAEEAVGALQAAAVVPGQVAGLLQRGQGVQRAGHQHGGAVGRVLQLQHLHGELDIHRSARPAFQVAGRRGFLQPPPHVADLRGRGRPPAGADDRLRARPAASAGWLPASRRWAAPCTAPAVPTAGPARTRNSGRTRPATPPTTRSGRSAAAADPARTAGRRGPVG